MKPAIKSYSKPLRYIRKDFKDFKLEEPIAIVNPTKFPVPKELEKPEEPSDIISETVLLDNLLKRLLPTKIVVEKEKIKKMILEIRNNIYGFETEEWFTPIEQQIGYDYREDLERILEERKELRKKHLEEQTK